MGEADYVTAWRHSIQHRAEVEASEWCGCFHCLAIFRPEDIDVWVDEENVTAVCPECGIDSVIGSASGYPITDAFLGQMRRHWFATGPKGYDTTATWMAVRRGGTGFASSPKEDDANG